MNKGFLAFRSTTSFARVKIPFMNLLDGKGGAPVAWIVTMMFGALILQAS